MNLLNLAILLFTLIASASAAALISGTDENDSIQVQKDSVPVEESNQDVFVDHLSKVNKRSTRRDEQYRRQRFIGKHRLCHHCHHTHRPHGHHSSYPYNHMGSEPEHLDVSSFSSRRHNHYNKHPYHYHRFHRGHRHRISCNRNRQVTTDAPHIQETTTAKGDLSINDPIVSILTTNKVTSGISHNQETTTTAKQDISREERIESILNTNQVTSDFPHNQETTTVKQDISREELIESIFNSNGSNTWENLLQPSTDSPLKSPTDNRDLIYDIDVRSSF